MRIVLKTKVEQDWKQVQNGFNESLFLQLNPPFPKVKLKRFDGSKKGDKVAMELNFGLWKDQWISTITHDKTYPTGFEFIDEGSQLPFPFKQWKHRHVVEKINGETYIIDDIEFSSRYTLMDPFVYPLLYLQFIYRKPVYRRVFRL